MIKSNVAVPSLPKGTTEIKIIERTWGIERCYVTPDGEEVCSPATFSTNYRNIDWGYCV